jgi:hypothetical protein
MRERAGWRELGTESGRWANRITGQGAAVTFDSPVRRNGGLRRDQQMLAGELRVMAGTAGLEGRGGAKKEEFTGFMGNMLPGNSFPQICVVSEVSVCPCGN